MARPDPTDWYDVDALLDDDALTYEGTETIHELVVGRELTGEPAF